MTDSTRFSASSSLPTLGMDGKPASALADADKEWLEADGLGGFASGTASGVRTRRYHALLLSATQPPTGRLVLVNGVEAWLEGPEGTLPVTPLTSQHYAPDTIHPDGWRRIAAFSATPWPTWQFRLDDVATGEAACDPAVNTSNGASADSYDKSYDDSYDKSGDNSYDDSYDTHPDISSNAGTGTGTASSGATASTVLSITHEIFAAGDGGDIVLRWRLDRPSGRHSTAGSQSGPLSAPGTATATATGLPTHPGLASDSDPSAQSVRNPFAGLRLYVRPLLSVRDYHSLHHRNDAFNFQASGSGGRISWRPYADRPAVSALSNGEYRHEPEWFERFLYDAERERGLDAVEDLASPGLFVFDIGQEPALMVLRAGDNRDMRVAERVARAERAERQRRASPLPLPYADPVFNALGHAVDSYFAERGRGTTVLAGFPWFTDWGRDTFISLRGLALSTGRFAEAAAILGEWAKTVSEGMLPNRFPDTGETPEYNSVDASLWFIVALHAYLQTGHASPSLTQTLQDAADNILQGYRHGTRFGIGMRNDGLIHAGLPGTQLTWMDARIGTRAVTPRVGKPVEIQALWINALRIASAWRPEWAALAEHAQASFLQRFVDEESGALFDIVDADGVPGQIDRSIRPNQIFAVGGLPYQIVDASTAAAIVAQVERTLLTPMGLRTLAPNDPHYVGQYCGAPDARDGAYHQGTVWPWLMGPFVEAWLRVKSGETGDGDGDRDRDRDGDKDAGAGASHDGTPARDRPSTDPSRQLRLEARQRFVAPLVAHLDEAGLGHVSEIADGDPPHTPRGTPFQAWSLAELLRIERLL